MLPEHTLWPEHIRWRLCVHEAGHVIVGLATGYTLIGVRIHAAGGAAEFEPAEYRSPVVGGDPDLIRRGLTLDVAGMIAEDLQYQLETFGNFMTPHLWVLAAEAARNYDTPEIISTRRLSARIEAGWSDEEHGSDYLCARDKAEALVLWAAVVAEREQRRAGASQSSARDDDWRIPKTDLLPEIRAAEDRAEAILKRDWDKLEQLASAIRDATTGHLTTREVCQLIGSGR